MSARTRALAGALSLSLSVPLSLATGGAAHAAGLLPLGCTPTPTVGLKPLTAEAVLAVASVRLHADDLSPTVGERHEVTAHVDANRPEGACLVFTKISGPGTGSWPLVRTSDSTGNASITLGSPDEGPEVIAVAALGGAGQVLASGTLTLAWGKPAPVPTVPPTSRPTVAPSRPPVVVPSQPPVVVQPHHHVVPRPALTPVPHPAGPPITVTAGPAPQPAPVQGTGIQALAAPPETVLDVSTERAVPTSASTSTGAIATAGAVIMLVLLLGALLLWHGPSRRLQLVVAVEHEGATADGDLGPGLEDDRLA